MSAIVVTGTDTDIGKTVFSAALVNALQARYWKPIQAGLEDESDSQMVIRLSGVNPDLVHPETYRLATPCSPHRAAELDGIAVDPDRLRPPSGPATLIIEGAGGVMVPLTRDFLFIDLLSRWACPTILVARTKLGTINHTLLSIEALRHRNIPCLGVAFVGDRNEDTEATIAAIGGVKRLGCLPILASLTRETIAKAFTDNFNLEDFRA